MLFRSVIERYLHLNRVARDNQKVWDEMMPLLDKGDLQRTEALLNSSSADLGKVLSYGMARAKTAGAGREEIEVAMEEGLMEVSPQLEKRIHYLAAFANMSTLLGLLGTIIGLISAFQAVANAAAAEKANLLSASISEAMNCTAFGLMVAIPLLVVSLFLTTKAGNIIDSLEMASLKTLNIISFAQIRPQQAAE